MPETMTTTRGWRHIERFAYVERSFDDTWAWLAGHLSELGTPLPGGGHSVELHVQPGGVDVSRPVRLHVGGLVAGEDRAQASLHWADATRPHLFPELEAMLEIAPVPNDTVPFTQLGVLANYRPPFGRLGALGDRLVGAEVTDVSLSAFLTELADAVKDHTVPPSLPADGEGHRRRAAVGVAGTRRVFLTVDGLAVRRGGAVAAGDALLAVPGVVSVSLNPLTGLATVDHDPAHCSGNELMAVLDDATAT